MKPLRIINFVLISLFFIKCSSPIESPKAPIFEKVVVNEDDSVGGYYLAVPPTSGQIKSVLVLLPGFGQNAENIFKESDIPSLAADQDILTIALAGGQKLYADSIVLTRLNKVLRNVLKRYAVAPDKFVIGGFSAGGTIALRYTELCKEFPTQFPIQPQGVFMIDSPVDIIDFWYYCQREIAKNASAVSVNEAKYISNLMLEEIGTLEDHLSQYEGLTPFNYRLQEPGNERFLKDVAVRSYHEIDINWILKERRRSAYEANFLNASELINRLLLLNNARAEFIQSKKKGYRKDGTRHPHSWSIVDEEELIDWVGKVF